MAATLLALRDIIVRYGDRTVLEVPSVDVCSGEVLGVIGPNGAGKSTLLRVMGLLLRPSKGNIYFQSEEASGKNALRLRRRMASVFQEPLLLNTSVFDNIALGLKLRGVSRGEIESRIPLWLERLGISHLASRPVRTLSGGEAQRTSLARAFVLNPQLLLLDEPFSPLDQPTRETLLADLRRILQETGITTVVVTHERREAFALANRVGVLRMGKLLQLGSINEVFMRPETEEVAEDVGIENRIPGIVESIAGESATVGFNGGNVRVMGRYELGVRVTVCIRPEDITLSRANEGLCLLNHSNRFRVRVTNVLPGMDHYRISLQCGATSLVAFVGRREVFNIDLGVGDEIIASFNSSVVHVISPLSRY